MLGKSLAPNIEDENTHKSQIVQDLGLTHGSNLKCVKRGLQHTSFGMSFLPLFILTSPTYVYI